MSKEYFGTNDTDYFCSDVIVCQLWGADENCNCPVNTYAGEDEWGPICLYIDVEDECTCNGDSPC
jgi:hypothetical protein